MMFADTIIISDLHLGSEVSRAPAALRMLKSASFNRLILLGDIFCDLNFGRLKKEHWKFLSYIRKLSNPKREIEVVWVEGNHDHGLSQVMSHLVGICVGARRHMPFGDPRPPVRLLLNSQYCAQQVPVGHASCLAENIFRQEAHDRFP